MRKLLVIIFLSVPALLNADPTWTVYVSTDAPEFGNSTEQVVSSTSDVKIELPVNDSTLSCQVWEPYYFQVPGISYPLVQHRYIECDLGNDYVALTEVGCGLKHTDVGDTNLILQTPKSIYRIILNCANFVDEK